MSSISTAFVLGSRDNRVVLLGAWDLLFSRNPVRYSNFRHSVELQSSKHLEQIKYKPPLKANAKRYRYPNSFTPLLTPFRPLPLFKSPTYLDSPLLNRGTSTIVILQYHQALCLESGLSPNPNPNRSQLFVAPKWVKTKANSRGLPFRHARNNVRIRESRGCPVFKSLEYSGCLWFARTLRRRLRRNGPSRCTNLRR